MTQPAFLILGIALTIGIIAWLARVQDRSWVSPASVFALIWAAYMPTIIFFVPRLDNFVAGMLWILASVTAVWVGSAIAGVICPPAAARAVVPSTRAVNAIRQLARWPIFIGIADILWLFGQRGLSFRDVLSFAAIMMVSVANRGENYAGEADTPVLERLAFTAMYLGVMYGGVLFRLTDRKRDKVLALGTLLVVIIVNTLHGSRFGSLYGGSCWLAGCLAVHVALSDPEKGVTSKFLFRFAIAGAVIVFVLSVGTMVVRYAVFSDENSSKVPWAYMLTDPFGFIAAFGIWFHESGTHPDGPLWGARVFRRIAGLWGTNYPLYAEIDVGFNSSNIFTIFRELMEDFTPWGSLELLLFFGFAARVSFWAAMRDDNRWAVPILTLVYIFTFTGVASSAFQYTTILVAMLVFTVSFWLLPPLVTARPEYSENS